MGRELFLGLSEGIAVLVDLRDYLLVVLGSLSYLVNVVVQDLRLGLLQMHPLSEQQVLLFTPRPRLPLLDARNLVELVEEAVARVGVVVAVQKAAALHIFEGVALGLGFFASLFLEVVPVLVPEGRQPEIEQVRVCGSFLKDFLVGSLLLNLFNHGVWWRHHTSSGWQLTLEHKCLGILVLHLLLFSRRRQRDLILEKIQSNLAVLSGCGGGRGGHRHRAIELLFELFSSS